MRTRNSLRYIAAAASSLAVLIALAASPVRADVTIKEKTVFDGIGEGGMMASEGENVTIISGDRLRQESTSKPTGGMMKRFLGKDGFKSATITRLDRKLIYTIDYDSKSYQEVPLGSFKEMHDAMAGMMGGPGSPGMPAEEQEAPITCQPVKLDVTRGGQKGTIGGLEAERIDVKGDQTCENTQTKQTCRMIYAFEHWVTPMTSVLTELHDFYRRQAQAMGMETDGRQMQAVAGAAGALASQNAEGLEAVMKELAKVDGYPVRMRVDIQKEGDCGGASAEGAGAMAEMKRSFKGLFGKKKKEAEEPEAPASGLTKVFGMSTEVLSVESTGAPDEAFEPPAGFKKVSLEGGRP